jgi:dTDP-glucose 4,6-dehydratase
VESNAYPKTVLMTGGTGFIGSNFVLSWLAEAVGIVVNLDKLTNAGNLGNLQSLNNDSRHILISSIRLHEVVSV